MRLLLACIAILGSTLAGRSLLALLERILFAGQTTRPRSEEWGVSILLGMGFTSAAAFVWSDMGFPLNVRFSWGQVALGFVAGLAAIIAHRRSVPRDPSLPSISPRGSGALARVCQVAVGVMITMAFAQALLTPQRFWDERAIFAIKARVLYEAGSIDAPELKHPDFVQGHPRYPLMLPLLERHLYSICGTLYDRWGKIWFPLMYAGLIFSFAGVLSRRYSADEGWLFAMLLAMTPVLMPDSYGFISGQADAPVASFHGVAVLLLWDGLQQPPGKSRRLQLFLASSIAASAAFVKDEGLAFLAVDMLAWGLTLIFCRGDISADTAEVGRLRSGIRHVVGMVGFALFAAVLLTPWMRHRSTLPTTTEMHYLDRLDVNRLIEGCSTLSWSVPHLTRRMFWEWKEGGLTWWMVLLAIVTSPRRLLKGPQLFLLLNLLGALSALIVAGMIAPAELKEHLGGSSSRFLMQIVPVGILFVAGAWGRSCPATK